VLDVEAGAGGHVLHQQAGPKDLHVHVLLQGSRC
jgi:hypothetical protein